MLRTDCCIPGYKDALERLSNPFEVELLAGEILWLLDGKDNKSGGCASETGFSTFTFSCLMSKHSTEFSSSVGQALPKQWR